MSLTPMMANRIIPKEYYHDEPKHGLYRITFCEKPINNDPGSMINFAKINFPTLQIYTKKEVEYKIRLIIRRWDILKFNNGKCYWLK